MLPGARCALLAIIFLADPGRILSAFLLVVLCGSVVYSLLQIVAAKQYRAVRPPALQSVEPISVLKPLAGLDLELESNLRTFFEQKYAAFEILFAVRNEQDPAVRVVDGLRRQYPNISSRLVITGEPPYANAKVYSLERMLAMAANELVIMSDSDIRVDPALLQTVAAEFQDQNLGIATCPYRAVPGPSLWSRLEATGMNTDFWGSALVARLLEGMHFAVGPTIAARRGVLQSIGGFERLKDYLAEDFVIGKFAAEAGHGVILSSYVIEHHIGDATLGGTWRIGCDGIGALGGRAPPVTSGNCSRCLFQSLCWFVPLCPRYGRFCLSLWPCGCWRLTQSQCACCGPGLTGCCCLWKMCSGSASGSPVFSETRSCGENGGTGCLPTAVSN